MGERYLKRERVLFRSLLASAFSAGLLLSLCSCVSNTVYVPVVEAGKAPVEQKTYIVQPGDTLYSIAWAFGLDFRQLVDINGLEAPYNVSVGQTLRLVSSSFATVTSTQRPSKPSAKKRPVKFSVIPRTTTKKPKTHWQTKRVGSWMMPARGKVTNIFSTKYGSSGKGLEIHGKANESIKAAAKGTVVYSGDGLRSYGNLLLIKHNDAYLSAYAFNQKLLVKAGDQVKQGQRIATMGKDGRGKPVLYFEIRRFGKPVNPMQYLKR